MSINTVGLVGRLGKDPELRTLDGGKKVVNISLAVKRNTNANETDWIQVQAWDRTAEFVANYLKKGRLVGVEGRLKQDTWQENGQNHQRVIVVANRVEALDSDPAKQQAPQAQAPAPQQQYAPPPQQYAPQQPQYPQQQQQYPQQQPVYQQPVPGMVPPPQMVPQQQPQLLGNDGMIKY